MTPRDGRAHVGVAQVQLGLVERRLRLGHVGRRGLDPGAPGLDLLARDEPGVLLDHGLAPREPRLGLGLRRLGLLERAWAASTASW